MPYAKRFGEYVLAVYFQEKERLFLNFFQGLINKRLVICLLVPWEKQKIDAQKRFNSLL